MEYEIKDNAIRIKLDNRNYANVTYHIEDDRIFLDSTFTPKQYRGKGIGGELMKAAMAYSKSKGLKIIPVCSFSVEYFKKHPEYNSLLHKG